MKSTIFFAFSLLLILEKQAAVLGFSGGSQGQLPVQNGLLVYDEDQNESEYPNQDQGYGQYEYEVPEGNCKTEQKKEKE
ncbi:PREDICTED: semenogelin-2-like, partial [Propithecus coquereli]|uniref:semenogelin-2-like n=1 Tax=Propithecus coquereli TaxID=379532 RepID=UPI00063EE5F1